MLRSENSRRQSTPVSGQLSGVTRPLVCSAWIGFALSSALLLLGCEGQEDAPRTVLIGIDGGSWNMIDPLLEAGELPHLAALRDRGVTADLTTVEPNFSPPVWTSIATGRDPGAHGVRFFFANRFSIQVPTLWERLAASGLRVGLYDFLVTWPPRDLPGGFVVPGWLRHDHSVSPPDLFERIGLPGYVYEVVDMGGPEDVVASIERELVEKPRYWNRLARELDPDVGAVTFYAVDVMSHRFYHTAFPEEFDPPIEIDPRFADVLPRTLRGIDSAVGEIVSALEPDDHVVIVSDHGFRANPKIFKRWGYDVPWLLEKAGIDPRRDGVNAASGWIRVGLEIETGREGEPEAILRRLEEFFTTLRTTEGDPLFRLRIVREPEDATTEDHPRWMVNMMRARLPAEAFFFALPNIETLERAWPDGTMTVGSESLPLSALTFPHVFTGDHHPVGIFFAAGRAIRHQAQRSRLSVLDVAPLLSYLAGRPIPDDLEGQLPEALILPEYIRRHPVERVAAADLPRLSAEGDPEVLETGDDEEIRERLRALGYL